MPSRYLKIRCEFTVPHIAGVRFYVATLMLVAHQVYVVAINALLLKRTKLAGIRQPGKTASETPDVATAPEPPKAAAVREKSQPNKKAVA